MKWKTLAKLYKARAYQMKLNSEFWRKMAIESIKKEPSLDKIVHDIRNGHKEFLEKQEFNQIINYNFK